MDTIQQKIDLTKRRRKYFTSDEKNEICPECGGNLVKENCTVALHVITDLDEGNSLTNANGSQFCVHCPVVVFDSNKLEIASKLVFKSNRSLTYYVDGIVDFEKVPINKRNEELGTDTNPLPLVPFLNELRIKEKKIGRNDPCDCGSGKKYKKCCG